MQRPPEDTEDGPPLPLTGVFIPSDRSAACVRASGIAAVAAALVFLMILIIEGSVGGITGDGIVFYVMTLLMFLVCAGSSYYAVKGERSMAALAVYLISSAQAIVFFAFMIHDAASKSCADAVLYFISCAPGESPSIPFLVVQYFVPIGVFILTAYMSWKLFLKLRSAEKRKRSVRGLVSVGGDLGAVSTDGGGGDGLG